jgi:Uma2 family endonuclease
MSAVAAAPIEEIHLKRAFKVSDIIDIPATLHDYWRLMDLPQYRLDYINQHIKGTMSYGSFPHEIIVNNILFQLNLLFEAAGYMILGSNRPIYGDNCKEIYQCDAHIAPMPVALHHYDKTKTATANPTVIVEVHSPSTRNYDLGEKLKCYQDMPSVQHIIFIETSRLHIANYTRTNKPNQWLVTTVQDAQQKLKILNKSVLVSKVYKNVNDA